MSSTSDVAADVDGLETEDLWSQRIDQSSVKLAEGVSPAKLASEFGEQTRETIDDLCNEAVMIAVGEGRGELNLNDFQLAFEIVEQEDDDEDEEEEEIEPEPDQAEDEEEEAEQIDAHADAEEATEETEDLETMAEPEPRQDDLTTAESEQDPAEMPRAELEEEVEDLRERVEKLEDSVSEVPLLKETLRRLVGGDYGEDVAEVTPVYELPGLAEERLEERERVNNTLEQHQEQLSTISDIGEEKTTKEEKIAKIVTFAWRQREDDEDKITVLPKSMAGAAGCSKRYAYDLVDELHQDDNYPWAFDASKREIHLEQDTPQRGLLIDFAKTGVQHDGEPLNKFNNEIGGNGGR